MSSNRLLLIDGHSTAFRAFYAMRSPEGFCTSTGQYTNAVFVFCRMLQRLLGDYEPAHIAVAFDTHAPTFRKEQYPEYKEGRKPTPPEFAGQIDLIIEALGLLGITTITKDGIEADDILATLATQGAKRGMEVYVASGDRDMFQLIDDQVKVLFPGSSAQNLSVMDPQTVEEKYGVTPQRYPELAALTGEAADNLAGVPGVGPKTAAYWLRQYDGLENLLANADKIGGKRGQALRDNVEAVRRNRRLNALLVDADLPVTLDDLAIGEGDRAGWDRLCDQLEFNTLRADVWQAMKQARGDSADADDDAGISLTVTTPDSIRGGLPAWVEAQGQATIGVSVVGDDRPGMGDATLVALARGNEAVVIDLAAGEDAVRQLGDVVQNKAGQLAYSNFKGAWHALHGAGIDAAQPAIDVSLGAYLLAPAARSYEVSDLARTYLGRVEPVHEGGDTLFGNEEAPAAWRAQAIADLAPVITERVANVEQDQLLETMEMPLTRILAHMEDTGIAIDQRTLTTLRADLDHEVERAREMALADVGRADLNLSSPKQLQEVLFDQLKMPPTRKTKRGYTTNAEALAQLYVQTEHPFLAHLLEHRDKIKLLQTVDGLAREVRPDGRIHTVFQQTVTATGRLSSTAPNLQNIPARTPTGLKIRDAFVAGEGFEGLMTVDYSQIEMRVMAAMSGDQALIDAFGAGEDLHKTMASMVFGVPAGEVTPQQRSRIKATSYGLAYGLSAFGLSRQLDISQAEATELRDAYFKRFGGIRDYLESIVEQARHTGYTQTRFGRRRYLPELMSRSRPERQMAERAALNAPIQGSAADIIKIAMVGVDAALSEEQLKSRMLLQVHDELIFEVAPGERDALERLVRDRMGHAVDLGVDLEVSVGYGATWKEAAH